MRRRRAGHKTNHHVSVLLRKYLAEIPPGEITVENLVLKLRRRSYGGILLLLTVLGLVPIVSFFSGTAIIWLGVQMVLGFPAPRLPRVVARRHVKAANLQRHGRQAVAWIDRAETVIRPRWLVLSGPLAMRLVGIVVTCLAVVLILPVPLINVPPAIALFLFALGILERDGLLLFLALVASLLAISAGIVMAAYSLGAVLQLLNMPVA